MGAPSFKATVKQDQKSLRDLQKKLKDLPRKMQTRELAKIARAGGTPVLKAARKIVPVGQTVDARRERRRPLKDTLAIRIRRYAARGRAVAIVGHESGQAPHAHLVHDGTKAHQIRVGFRTSGSGAVSASLNSKGLPPRALSNQRRFFGKVVHHPGVKPFPYLEKATTRSRDESVNKMAKKARQIQEKLAKEP